jgi:hypothetical protein
MLKTMQPFGIGHMQDLEAIASPFLSGATLTYGDLIRAVMICSRPSNSAAAFPGGWLDVLKFKLWIRRCRGLDWRAESVKLQRHVLAGLRGLRDAIRADLTASGVSI